MEILDSDDQRTPRHGVTDEHRVRFVDAPLTPARLPQQADFVPVAGVLYVHVHADGTGRASAHLWSDVLAHAGTSFNAEIRDGALCPARNDSYSFPDWLRPELDAMAAAAHARVRLIDPDRPLDEAELAAVARAREAIRSQREDGPSGLPGDGLGPSWVEKATERGRS